MAVPPVLSIPQEFISNTTGQGSATPTTVLLPLGYGLPVARPLLACLPVGDQSIQGCLNGSSALEVRVGAPLQSLVFITCHMLEMGGGLCTTQFTLVPGCITASFMIANHKHDCALASLTEVCPCPEQLF